MNWNIIEGKWKEMAGSIREQWGKLTDNDLEEIAGKRDKLEGALQAKYGYTQEQASQHVDAWADRIKDHMNR